MNISTMKCSENEWEWKYSSTWCLIFILQMIGHTFFSFSLSLQTDSMLRFYFFRIFLLFFPSFHIIAIDC